MSGEIIEDVWSESSGASQDGKRKSLEKTLLVGPDHEDGAVKATPHRSDYPRTGQTQQSACVDEHVQFPARVKRARHGGWDGGEGDEGDGFGAYMRVKVRKLREQFDADFADREGPPCAGNHSLFAGVTVWVDGATTPSREQIRELVGARGGRFETYFTPDCVTHVICKTLAQATRLRLQKIVGAKRISVVDPTWITDSIGSDRLLPAARYPVQGMTDPSQRSIASFFPKPKSVRKPP
jgi:hypothetical protein